MTDAQIFQTNLEIFINDSDPDLRAFIKYFKKKYAFKATYWAYCYRIGAKINTNMINESFHSFLKGKICGKKKIKTVYECLRCIETYVSIKAKYSELKCVRPQRTTKIRVLRTRHHKAVKNEGLYTIYPFNSECEDECSHTWLISSFEKEEQASKKKKEKALKKKKKTIKESDSECSDDDDSECSDDDDSECSHDEELDDVPVSDDRGEGTNEDDGLQLYIVQRNINFRKSRVSVECTICKVALEEYSCTCIDYLIKCNLCKHIHAVAMYCRRNDCWCKCGLTLDDVCNMEIANTSDMNGGDDDVGFNDVNPIEDSHDEEDRTENLRNKLMAKIQDMDEETLQNVLQYISFKDRPAPFKEKSKQRGKNEKQKRIFS